MEQDVGNTDDAAIDLSFEKDIRQLLRAATGCGRIPKKNLENVRREHERLAAVKTQRNIQAKWSSWMKWLCHVQENAKRLDVRGANEEGDMVIITLLSDERKLAGLCPRCGPVTTSLLITRTD